MHRTIASLFVFATFAITPLAALAVPITVPTDLIPGQSYRLAFVTSTTRDGTDTDITLYNAFVSGVANGVTELAALGTTWTAIGSTTAVDARDNTGTNPTVSTGVPIYRLDNTRIADDNVDLWDLLDAVPLAIDETGSEFGTQVWTGTLGDGTMAADFALGDLFPAGVLTGNSFATDGFWVSHLIFDPAQNLPLYAMSGVLTVVPEPSSVVLAAFGFAALAAFGWRRKR